MHSCSLGLFSIQVEKHYSTSPLGMQAKYHCPQEHRSYAEPDSNWSKGNVTHNRQSPAPGLAGNLGLHAVQTEQNWDYKGTHGRAKCLFTCAL